MLNYSSLFTYVNNKHFNDDKNNKNNPAHVNYRCKQIKFLRHSTIPKEPNYFCWYGSTNFSKRVLNSVTVMVLKGNQGLSVARTSSKYVLNFHGADEWNFLYYNHIQLHVLHCI